LVVMLIRRTLRLSPCLRSAIDCSWEGRSILERRLAFGRSPWVAQTAATGFDSQ
jgi:hypothetical protein